MRTKSHGKRMARYLMTASLAGILAVFAGCPLTETTGLCVINHSNVLVHALYVSPVEDRVDPNYGDHEDWGPNLIEGQTDLGYGTVITISDIPNGTYDILVVADRTPLYGGDRVWLVQWGVTFDGGYYRWELEPTKNGEEADEVAGAVEKTDVAPPTDGEPAVWVEYLPE